MTGHATIIPIPFYPQYDPDPLQFIRCRPGIWQRTRIIAYLVGIWLVGGIKPFTSAVGIIDDNGCRQAWRELGYGQA